MHYAAALGEWRPEPSIQKPFSEQTDRAENCEPHGFSVEYLDHRAYTPGDDMRALDWKVLARTDKYHIKLFEDETNLRAHIVLAAPSR